MERSVEPQSCVSFISVRLLSDLVGVSYRKHLIGELVVDGHSRERLKELVRVAPAPPCKHEEAAATIAKGGSAAGDTGEEGEAVESDIPPGMYCRHCYRLELEGHIVRNEMMAYHLKYRSVPLFPAHFSGPVRRMG